MALSQQSHNLELFNKTLATSGQGTLVGNWWEERELKEATGVSRTVHNSHFPKIRGDLYRKPPNELHFRTNNLNTFTRVNGATVPLEYTSQYQTYGNGKNKALDLPQKGARTLLQEREFQQIVQNELQAVQLRQQQEDSTHYFDTTQKTHFVPKQSESKIGSRFMCDQNLNQGNSKPDELFGVEIGTMKKTSIGTKSNLNQVRNQQQNYAQEVPFTYYVAKQNEGNYYCSTANQNRNFGLNNTFVKSFQQYKHSAQLNNI